MLKPLIPFVIAINCSQAFSATARPTIAKEQKSELENDVFYRMLRGPKINGKHYNIVSNATFFIMSIRYTGHMKYRSHNCLFIVRGNLSLEEVQRGMYRAEDIISTECSIEDQRM